MARTNRERFARQVELVEQMQDGDVKDAIKSFVPVVDPERPRPKLPKPDGHGGLGEHEQVGNGTAYKYLMALRCSYERGLDLLEADADTVDAFASELPLEPEDRVTGLVDWGGTMTPGSANNYVAALRGFYRFCNEPGKADDRPDTAVSWDGAWKIKLHEEQDTSPEPEELPDVGDLNSLREAVVRKSQNTLRDRAFLEVVAGTGQRVTAVVTLRVGDVYLDGSEQLDHPHVLLNKSIAGDGDKGAIEQAGRLRPIAGGDTGPIRQWIENHPLGDAEVRAEHGAPDDFEDCYLFVGSLSQGRTDATGNWGSDSARDMLARRKADTADLTGVDTVANETDVRPKTWRAYAYTRSLALDIDESDRRKMFGWAKGSDTGQEQYDATATAEAAERVVDAWTDEYGDADAESLRSAVHGEIAGSGLPPEVREDLAGDEDFVEAVADAVADVLGD